MSGPEWRLPVPAPARGEVFDQVRVTFLTLRFPAGTPVGGEVGVVRTYGTQTVDERVMILEPGEADPILAPVLAWLRALLERRTGLGPSGAPPPAPPVSQPPPAPHALGTLG